MRVDRLETLVEILCEVRDAKRAFDLNYWVFHTTEEQPKDEYCGTIACAVGYGALDRRLSDQGLKIVIYYVDAKTGKVFNTVKVGSIEDFNKISHDKEFLISEGVVGFNEFTHFRAIHEFFEFNFGEAAGSDFLMSEKSTASYLFWAVNYKLATDINEVIKRVQDVIATNEQCARDYFETEISHAG